MSAFPTSTAAPLMGERVSTFFMLILPPMLLVLGTFGNLIALVVLSKMSVRRFHSYAKGGLLFYLQLLAIVDLATLYAGLGDLWLREVILIDLRLLHDWACRAHVYLVYFCVAFCLWLLVAALIDRLVSVFTPCSPRYLYRSSCVKAWGISTLISILLAGINLHLLLSYRLQYTASFDPITGNQTTHAVCTYSKTMGADALHGYIWPWVDFVISSALPAVLILVFTAILLVFVCREHRRTAGHLLLNHHGDNLHDQQPHQSSYSEKALRKKITTAARQKCTADLNGMLIAVALFAFITTVPHKIFMVVNDWCSQAQGDHMKSESELAALTLTTTMLILFFYCNNALKFFVYLAASSEFRFELSCGFAGRTVQAVKPGAYQGLAQSPDHGTTLGLDDRGSHGTELTLTPNDNHGPTRLHQQPPPKGELEGHIRPKNSVAQQPLPTDRYSDYSLLGAAFDVDDILPYIDDDERSLMMNTDTDSLYKLRESPYRH